VAAQPFAERAIGRDGDQAVGEGRVVAGRYYVTAVAVVDALRRPGHTEGHRGNSERRCLEYGPRQPFMLGRQDDQVGCGEEIVDVVAEAEQLDSIVLAQLGDATSDEVLVTGRRRIRRRACLRPAGQQDAERGNPWKHVRQDPVHELQLTLAVLERSHEEHHDVVGRASQRSTHAIPVGSDPVGVNIVQVNAVVDHVAPTPDAAPQPRVASPEMDVADELGDADAGGRQPQHKLVKRPHAHLASHVRHDRPVKQRERQAAHDDLANVVRVDDVGARSPQYAQEASVVRQPANRSPQALRPPGAPIAGKGIVAVDDAYRHAGTAHRRGEGVLDVDDDCTVQVRHARH